MVRLRLQTLTKQFERRRPRLRVRLERRSIRGQPGEHQPRSEERYLCPGWAFGQWDRLPDALQARFELAELLLDHGQANQRRWIGRVQMVPCLQQSPGTFAFAAAVVQ